MMLKKKYYEFINDVAMAGHKQADGTYVKGIEDYLPKERYLDRHAPNYGGRRHLR